MIKGVAVFFYMNASIFLGLILLLVIAGIAEGFLEPARNKAAMEVNPERARRQHSHKHPLIAYSTSTGLQLSVHEHGHAHELGVETTVSSFQTAGIFAFATGSLIGSILLENSWSLMTLTWSGALILFIAGIVSIFLTFSVKKKN